MKGMLVTAVVVMSLLAATSAGAAVFTGSLVSQTGIIAPDWGTVSLGWTVTQLANGTWRYDYDFLVPSKNISHIIIETSLGFKETDIIYTNWASVPPDAADVQLPPDNLPQGWTENQGNPGLVGSLYGIKFNTISPLPSTPQQSTGLHWFIEFETAQSPVWGDFYAKNGKTPGGTADITAWNASFGTPDPTDPARDGTINNKILRPDTVIPEWSTCALAALSAPLFGLSGLLRRRKAG